MALALLASWVQTGAPPSPCTSPHAAIGRAQPSAYPAHGVAAPVLALPSYGLRVSRHVTAFRQRISLFV